MRGLLTALGVIVLAQSGGRDAAALVEAASAYVAEYQEQLSAVVADETYTQQVRAQVPRDTGMPPSRVMKSEVFFLHIPGRDWMAMRDIATIDGRPNTDRTDLKDALRRLDAPEVARQLKAYNSRFNLGRVIRNFNEPTLSLLVLDARHRGRFTFTRGRVARIGTVAVQAISFRETAGPTLIGDLDGGDVYSAGEFVIEPDTGRVRRARLAMTIGSVRITFSTEYAQDTKLDMLVPVRFGERYEDGTPAKGGNTSVRTTAPYEDILCEARYTNFRRFEVKAIIR